MGEVFLARLEREEGFAKLLVVKRILPELSESSRFLEMFSAEARIAAALNHPQVVQVTDFGRIGKNCFLAMEYIDGSDLAARLDVVREQKGELPLAFIVAVGLACLRALDYAHRRTPPVVHGDVSPSNVLVGRQGEVKLSDFGLARIAGQGAGQDRSSIQGKLSYMAPEVARGRPADERSDLFGVGGILFELASLHPPREANLDHARNRALAPVAQLKPDIHPALAKVIDQALSVTAQERFQEASEMEEALLQISTTLSLDPGPRTVSAVVTKILGDGPRTCAEATPRTLVALPSMPRRRLSILATGIFVLFGGLAVYVLLANQQSDPDTQEPDSGVIAVVSVEEPPGEESDAGVSQSDLGPPRKRIARRLKPLVDAGSPVPATNPVPEDPDRVAKALPTPLGFSLHADGPVTCSLDGGPRQSTPLDYQQLLGDAHVIRLQSRSGFSATIRMEATEKSGQVKLAFRSEPFAVLYIDGTPKGLTPKGGILLDRGSHKIYLAPSGKKPVELTLQLR